MKRIKILAISYLFPNNSQPAYGIFVLNRLRALQQACDIRVISPIQWYPWIHKVRGGLWGSGIPLHDRIRGVEVHHPRFATIPRFLKWIDAITYLWAVRSVVKKLERCESFDFDLIDLHWTYPDIAAGYYLARKYRKKFIVTVRGHEALYLNEHTLRERMLAHLLRKADFVITLSEELRGLVIALGVHPERTRVVLNGVDLSRFRPAERASSRQSLGLPTNKKIIISVGRLTEGKGHDELVQMMPGLSKTQDVELYIIGGVNPESDFSSVIRSLISKLALKNVHLVDRADYEMLPAWYNAADLFCLATKREGCPNVVLEALACGTPVVVTNVGAVGELIQDGVNGFLVPEGMPGSLEHCVRRALGTDWNRRGIAEVMNQRGWSACAEQVVGVYQAVLGHGIG
jgi:teichuronic acid biosynthesis glycosyltransferase TuaC